MNRYMENLNRMEFLVTLECTGRCRHCLNGGQEISLGHIDRDAAAEAVRKVAEHYNIKTVVIVGGEAMIYPAEVFSILTAARDAGIPGRQLVTNGFFSRVPEMTRLVTEKLVESGVNDILLSVDAFHQEAIPLDPVIAFAKDALAAGVSRLRVYPAWLANAEADNPYNEKTRKILERFEEIGVESSDGINVFARGNAVKYLMEYFDDDTPLTNPYTEDPEDIRTLRFEPNGDVLNGNMYQTDILEILEQYKPESSAENK